MPKAKVEDDEFIQLFKLHGASGTAERTQSDIRGVYKRRKRLENKYQTRIIGPNQMNSPTIKYSPRVELDIRNGTVLVASDAHYWPGPTTTAHRAFVRFCEEMNPSAVIMNGDVFDGASISRHPPIGWETSPTVEQELEVCKERLAEIEYASPNAAHIWTFGNHDQRFETKLASHVPEFKGVHGIHLKDHFEGWRPGWACWINGKVAIKHRWKGGVHATHNNTMGSGLSMVTGHLHSLKVSPYTDYTGTRFGVDTGTLADLSSEQFSYAEDNPANHRSGFAVLTFNDGNLLWPELCHVLEPGKVEFRGEVIKV
ncbi:MAG: metallophosphoesterase [Candidatus Omnitrophica bacterium]|nr:metallophosphoesterase [Candidatus Omnitrophota bacterium]